VTAHAWPTPRPKPIGHLSPSRAEDLRICPRRVAFARDRTFATFSRPGLNAAAGIVAHAVYERVATRDYDFPHHANAETVVGQLWEQETARVHGAFTAAWAPARVPAPDQWPNMARTRRAIIRTQRPLLVPGTSRPDTSLATPAPSPPMGEHSEDTPRLQPRTPTSLPWTEQRLVDNELGIEGTPDRVERGDHGVLVLDLKSGWDQEHATAEQRRQLLVYIHLVRHVLGEWPAGAAIDSRRGRFPIDFDEDAVCTAVADLVKLREEFNDYITRNVEPAAHPSADACRWCSYRIVCHDSQTTIAEGDRLPLVTTGTVATVHSQGERTVIDVDLVLPPWRAGHTVRVLDVTWSTTPEVGETLSLAGVHASSDGRSVVGAWNTQTFAHSQT
jgi:RecB family exonuclease